MIKEIWKDIPGWEGFYKISNLGNIYSIRSQKKLAQRINKNGYRMVRLYRNSIGSGKYTHRLVAESFVKNDNHKLQVNHINGIRTDNISENLEWTTCSENNLHAFRILGRIPSCKGKFGALHSGSKPVCNMDSNGNIIALYDSASEAARMLNTYQSTISSRCRGMLRDKEGYLWKYVSKDFYKDNKSII